MAYASIYICLTKADNTIHFLGCLWIVVKCSYIAPRHLKKLCACTSKHNIHFLHKHSTHTNNMAVWLSSHSHLGWVILQRVLRSFCILFIYRYMYCRYLYIYFCIPFGVFLPFSMMAARCRKPKCLHKFHTLWITYCSRLSYLIVSKQSAI